MCTIKYKVSNYTQKSRRQSIIKKLILNYSPIKFKLFLIQPKNCHLNFSSNMEETFIYLFSSVSYLSLVSIFLITYLVFKFGNDYLIETHKVEAKFKKNIMEENVTGEEEISKIIEIDEKKIKTESLNLDENVVSNSLSNTTYRSQLSSQNVLTIDEPCIMKCKKHNFAYQIVNGERKKIEDGETIQSSENVKFLTVNNCEDYKPYLKHGKDITMEQSIKQLNSLTKKSCSFICERS